MPTDRFTVPCDSCGKPVDVFHVSEFHNVGGFRGYSYTVICECGSACHHDGNDGDFIPEPMKRAAAVRHRALTVLWAIDYQRRALPASSVKALLKDVRVKLPEPLDAANDEWIVYQFCDGRLVSYCPESEVYTVRGGGPELQFSTVAELVVYVGDQFPSQGQTVQ